MVRDDAEQREIDATLEAVKQNLLQRLKEHGWGKFVGPHESLGVLKSMRIMKYSRGSFFTMLPAISGPGGEKWTEQKEGIEHVVLLSVAS